MMIAPLNTDPDNTFLPLHKPTVLFNMSEVHNVVNLENFTWHKFMQNDDEIILAKKKLISEVRNQFGCGCCFAMVAAQGLSDHFVISGVVNWSPRISETAILSCNPKNQCGGGNVAMVLKNLETIGVEDYTCVDYSWCNNSPLCTKIEHFAVMADYTEALNKKIPTSCGCYYKGDKFLYKPDKFKTVQYSIGFRVSIAKFRYEIKKHILNYGTPMASLAIYDNFKSGNFGVYFEKRKNDGTFSRFVVGKPGFHAVVVVGWGVEKNIPYDTNKIGDVPYWYCRNTWGKNWGEDGYFKIAMFPFNRLSQIDRTTIIGNNRTGGVILIRTTKQPQIIKKKKINVLPSLDKSVNFYQQTPKSIKLQTPITTINISLLFILIFIWIFINLKKF